MNDAPSPEPFAALLRAASAQKRPPVHLWQPAHTGQIDIRIDAAGTWWHEGARITRNTLVTLFASILRREGDAYFLVTPAEMLRIEVEDVPLVAVDFERREQSGEQEILFVTATEDYVRADADHVVWIRNDTPYMHVRDGLNARISRACFYRLSEYIEDTGPGMVLRSAGVNFALN